MKILVAGDFCPQYRVQEKFIRKEYESVLVEVKKTTECVDYSVVNFECPVASPKGNKIVKQGPSLQCSENGIEAIKWGGFNCITLANNHFLDYGKEGVENTLIACEKYGIDIVGGGMNLQEASKILYKEIDGKTLAIINCCEHEFSIATKDTAGSNPLNPIKQYYAIKEAKEKADYVLVIVHGGHEHYQLPSPRMQETYRFFIDAGADVVVNHHQHCYSGYEEYNERPIFYGLGNFCFDKSIKKKDSWYEGYMVQLNIKNKKITFDIIPYTQCTDSPCIKVMKGMSKTSFLNNMEKINSIISNSNYLNKEFDNYVTSKSQSVKALFSTISTSFFRGLVRRNFIPFFISNKNLILMFDRISCESHRDILLQVLTKIRNN